MVTVPLLRFCLDEIHCYDSANALLFNPGSEKSYLLSSAAKSASILRITVMPFVL